MIHQIFVGKMFFFYKLFWEPFCHINRFECCTKFLLFYTQIQTISGKKLVSLNGFPSNFRLPTFKKEKSCKKQIYAISTIFLDIQIDAISTIFLDIFCNPKTHETPIHYLSYSWYPSIHSLPLRYLISVFWTSFSCGSILQYHVP